MRIDNETLLRVADQHIKQQVDVRRGILAVYLHGSLTQSTDHLHGDSGDVDLVFVNEYQHTAPREFVRVTDDVTLDIANHVRTDYNTPRNLRSHPWLGPTIYNFQILYDPRHFLDFVQASLRDQFFRPVNVLNRAQALVGAARRSWFEMQKDPFAEAVADFLEAAANVANGIVSLEGGPLAERRMLTQFFERTQSMGQPTLYTDMLEMLGAGEIASTDLQSWMKTWDAAFSAVFSNPEADIPAGWGLHPLRKRYYNGALLAQLQSDRPADALWPLLRTWSRLASQLPADHVSRQEWESAMTQIGLRGENFWIRLQSLDRYIDLIEETLEAWARSRGVDSL